MNNDTSLTIPSTPGTARNFSMLLCGRLFCGLCAGLICLVVPTYLGEIASPNIRGLLGMVFNIRWEILNITLEIVEHASDDNPQNSI